jgi:hypothetical protein
MREVAEFAAESAHGVARGRIGFAGDTGCTSEIRARTDEGATILEIDDIHDLTAARIIQGTVQERIQLA